MERSYKAERAGKEIDKKKKQIDLNSNFNQSGTKTRTQVHFGNYLYL